MAATRSSPIAASVYTIINHVTRFVRQWVIFQFWRHFSFGDVSALVRFQLWLHFSFGNISVLATFQLW